MSCCFICIDVYSVAVVFLFIILCHTHVVSFLVTVFITQWGLLITFIELIKNPKYNFWRKSFIRTAPEMERVFESIARSCLGASFPAVMQQQTQP